VCVAPSPRTTPARPPKHPDPLKNPAPRCAAHLPHGPGASLSAIDVVEERGARVLVVRGAGVLSRPVQTQSSRFSPVETPRLRLTPIRMNDFSDLMSLSIEPQIALWTGPWTEETVRGWVRSMARAWSTSGIGKWVARDRTDGTLIGRGSPALVELDGEHVLEVGWAVRDSLTGRGYATEIGRAALDWAAKFEPHRAVVAYTEIHNQPS